MVEATATIYARGRVQGVGFRPFVYRTATNLGLTGYVTNLKDGTVKIVVEGDREEVKRFLEELKTRSPPMSEIDKVTLTWEPYKGLYKKFRIRRSEHKAVATLSFFPPPDIGICDECAGDVLQPSSR
ncbi:TPA: carbamoyltransferase HypF, partial [Candidatus Bathyarchaeota archaeon]|nr:carbamoyltransferase HypF [Candidatus Bathyarchaeota archaeon]